MHRFLLAAFLSVALIPGSAHGQLRLDLNIPALKLTVYDGEQLLETYPIAVGMPSFPTPTGSFEITHAEWNPWWNPPTHRDWARNEQRTPPGPQNPMGRIKLFFLPLYFIHGTSEAESIGTPASHGCVRMRNEDVVELATLIHQRAAPDISETELNRLAARWGSTRRVNFRPDIPVTIRYDPVEVQGGEILVYPDVYDRNALHTESVYQALIRAGYDVSALDLADVRRFVEKAKGQKVPVVTRIDEAFEARIPLMAG